MNIDLLVIGLVAFFAIVGAFTGAAKQVSRLVAAIAAGVLSSGTKCVWIDWRVVTCAMPFCE